MQQDAYANEQKAKQPKSAQRNEFDFVTAISDRQLGARKRRVYSFSYLHHVAEDELVQKRLKEMSCDLPGAARSTFLMEFSPDGTKVASTHGNHQIFVSDVRTGKHIKTLVGHPRTPWCIAFHPTSNQIIASGCLGGQVRIWDLSGGSELWTVAGQSVIASIAFHPDDRLLVIATFNELFFWDWSKPEPFMHIATSSAKEKVRYVAFDKLGHKLITGITNNPHTRWDRLCSTMPIAPPEPPHLPVVCRRVQQPLPPRPSLLVTPLANTIREPLSTVPERERRITHCYHELVQQYEVLVHRYLQIYRRPVMIDQGTDPMEVDNSSQSTPVSAPSTPASASTPLRDTTRPSSPIPSTSGTQPSARTSMPNHTAKNRIWRTIFVSDSGESSSSGSSKGKSVRRAPPSGASINQLKTKPDGDRSADEDSDDKSKPPDSCNKAVRQYSKVRQLNLSKSRKDPSTSKTNIEFFKHFEKLISHREANQTNASNENVNGSTNSEAETPDSGASTVNENKNEQKHLSDVINSAKLFVSKYKRMFQQLGIRDLPDPTPLPSTSGTSGVKPSKSTNTNSGEGGEAVQAQRKRRIRPTIYKNIPLSSSDDDSSEDEPHTKIRRPANTAPINGQSKDNNENSETVVPPPRNESNSNSVQSTATANVRRETVPQRMRIILPQRWPTSSSLPRVAPLTLDRGRRRYFTHRLTSPFQSTRLDNHHNRLPSRLSIRPIYITTNSPPAASSNFAQDEVVNYAERDGEELQTSQSPAMPSTSSGRAYHPFDPPPDVMSINPENIGIGSMYANIIQELEATLIDVGSIRFRLGEMSDMLGSISNRLENITIQSNSILHNLNSSLEDLPAIEEENNTASGPSVALDAYLSSLWTQNYRNSMRPSLPVANPVNSDHTYPLNPESSQNATLSPLHMSLQCAVTHIQRHATHLRQQIGSIERIDRAMIEVVQLQMMRRMFGELHTRFGGANQIDNDSFIVPPRDLRDSHTATASQSSEDQIRDASRAESSASTSSNRGALSNGPTRSRPRKNHPKCVFFMQRPFRRHMLKQRLVYRGRPYNRRMCGTRGTNTHQRVNTEICNHSMARRLEYHLLEHTRQLGRDDTPSQLGGSAKHTDMGEHMIALRLNNCRCRMNRILGEDAVENLNANVTAVTADGRFRFDARQTLMTTLENITRRSEYSSPGSISSTLRTQIWEIIEQSLLLSDVLLLQIVDSIPPSTGMNLDDERESLSLRINQLCHQMIHNRSRDQSTQLTSSLRRLRVAMRNVTEDLDRTYTARRNAMLPAGNNEQTSADASRQSLLENIESGVRTLMRMRSARGQCATRFTEDPHFSEWCRSLKELLKRHSHAQRNNSSGQQEAVDHAQPSTSSAATANNTERPQPPAVIVEDASSSDETNGVPREERALRILEVDSSGQVISSSTCIPSRATGAEAMMVRRRAALLREVDNMRQMLPMITRAAESNPNQAPPTRTTQSEVSAPQGFRINMTRQGISERLDEFRTTGILRPRFLHPWYNVNPFDDAMEDHQREAMNESDMIPTATPNHRIQVWEFSQGVIPNITNAHKNLVVSECKIHNDASVDYSSDGKFLVTLLPAGGYLNITNRLGVYSIEWETLGDLLFVTSFEQNAVSVSLSPTNRHLLVGLSTRRVTILPTENMPMARIFRLPKRRGNLTSMRVLEQGRDSANSINCIRWLPVAGQGLIFGTNTGHLKLLT